MATPADPIMTVTGMEIIHDAVKIGLGALIGGFFTFAGTWLSHRKELDKIMKHRIWDNLEKAVSNFELYWNSYGQLLSTGTLYIHCTYGDLKAIPGNKKKLQMCQETLQNRLNDIGIAQSLLLLHNHQKANQTIIKIVSQTKEVISELSKLEKCDETVVKRKHKIAKKNRAIFYQHISKHYC